MIDFSIKIESTTYWTICYENLFLYCESKGNQHNYNTPMKLRNYIIPLLAACVWASCSQDDDLGPQEPDTTPDAFLSLNTDVTTKAAGDVDPRDIVHRLTVFVYSGDHCYYKDSINETQTITSVTYIPVKAGNAVVCAVANATNEQVEALSKMTTISEESSALIEALSGLNEETHTHLSMSSEILKVSLRVSHTNCIGYGDASGVPNGINIMSTPILLYRNVARVQLSELKLQKETEFGTAIKFDLKKVFVANVKSKAHLLPTTKGNAWGGPTEVNGLVDAAYWYGTFDKPDDGLNSIKLGTSKDYLCYNFSADNYTNWIPTFPYHDETLLATDMNKAVTVNAGKSFVHKKGDVVYPIGNFFYVYENTATEKYPTLLVICGDYTYTPKWGTDPTTLKDRYYALVVNGTDNQITGSFEGVSKHAYIKRNTKYSILLNIAGTGSDTPDPSVRAHIGSQIKVLDWKVIELDSSVD